MVCKAMLDNVAAFRDLAEHSCVANLEAAEKEREEAFNGLERGRDYQLCLSCSRDIQLATACHHMICPCKQHFCYKCGEATIKGDLSHWEGSRCPLYPVAAAVAARLKPAVTRILAIQEHEMLVPLLGLNVGADPAIPDQERAARFDRILQEVDAQHNPRERAGVALRLLPGLRERAGQLNIVPPADLVRRLEQMWEQYGHPFMV